MVHKLCILLLWQDVHSYRTSELTKLYFWYDLIACVNHITTYNRGPSNKGTMPCHVLKAVILWYLLNHSLPEELFFL